MPHPPPRPPPARSLLRIFVECLALAVVLEAWAYSYYQYYLALEHPALDEQPLHQRPEPPKPKPAVAASAAAAAVVRNTTTTTSLAEEEEDDEALLRAERQKTAARLEHMGVDPAQFAVDDLPPWSQILANFNGGIGDDNHNNETYDDEPVVLGLENCAAFRTSTDINEIGVGPAGLFSTGTNLIQSLVRKNCGKPQDRTVPKYWVLQQVPWGKHNPADARFYHQVKNPTVANRSAILPVVAIRHPYTWMSAMCKGGYNTRWKHDPGRCHETLGLKHPVEKVPYGFKQYNATHPVPNAYDSLAHMWLEWYKPYFLDARYHQTPRLMVRHEDMVYRPQKVVAKICDCIGGTNKNANQDWDHPDGFVYVEESANRGKGHGEGRSGLLSAVVKYGQPLRHWYHQYAAADRTVAKAVFQGEADPDLRKIFAVFRYPLFGETHEPTRDEREASRSRKDFLEGLKKEEKARHDAEQDRRRREREAHQKRKAGKVSNKPKDH